MKLGDALYQTVPVVYRNRDNGDLKAYFAACGSLLDQVQATLEQRLADNFPDRPINGTQACQDWLLPYFAQLMDVRLVSPLVEGRRDEIAQAIRWRQAKGTLRVVEDVAEAVAQMEKVLQEGWKRVAITPRLDVPLIPATAYGYDQDAPEEHWSLAVRHPGLPALTVDFRCPSGAVATVAANPAVRSSTVGGVSRLWRQASHHGVPCHPGHFDDVSRRTVDFRCSDWRLGHHHPRKMLLYSVPPAGLFPPGVKTVNWSVSPSATFLELIDMEKSGDLTVFRNKSYDTDSFVPVRIQHLILLGDDGGGVADPDSHTWRFEGLILANTVQIEAGRLELADCAVHRVQSSSDVTGMPTIAARDCLFHSIEAKEGSVRLEYCTILESTRSKDIRASDCIFMGPLRKEDAAPDPPDPPDHGCLRFCRVPRNQEQGGMGFFEVTRRLPVMVSTTFGQRGCGVLHPATPDAVRHGGEDGGEMGAYHSDYFGLLEEAVVEKLRDYLPVGMEAVVIMDEQLLNLPD